MTLQELLERRKLAPKETTAQEVGDLMHLAEQYLADAQVETISPDLRFPAAYQAALQLATIPLHCAGYRPVGDPGLARRQRSILPREQAAARGDRQVRMHGPLRRQVDPLNVRVFRHPCGL